MPDLLDQEKNPTYGVSQTTDLSSFQARSNKKRLFKIALGVVAGLISVLAVTSYITNHSPPNPADPAVKELTASANQELENLFGQFEAQAKIQSVERSFKNHCGKGVDDWKRDDPYNFRCTYHMARYYGFSGNYKTGIKNIENALEATGWKTETREDEHAFTKAIEGTCQNCEVRKPGPWGESVFRLSSYQNNDVTIMAEIADRTTGATIGFELLEDPQMSGFDEFEREQKEIDVKSIMRNTLQDHEYVVGIGMQKIYLEK